MVAMPREQTQTAASARGHSEGAVGNMVCDSHSTWQHSNDEFVLRIIEQSRQRFAVPSNTPTVDSEPTNTSPRSTRCVVHRCPAPGQSLHSCTQHCRTAFSYIAAPACPGPSACPCSLRPCPRRCVQSALFHWRAAGPLCLYEGTATARNVLRVCDEALEPSCASRPAQLHARMRRRLPPEMPRGVRRGSGHTCRKDGCAGGG